MLLTDLNTKEHATVYAILNHLIGKKSILPDTLACSFHF